MATSAELSSLTSSLEELRRRVTSAAEAASDAGQASDATELFAAEQALQEAVRRLRRSQGQTP